MAKIAGAQLFRAVGRDTLGRHYAEWPYRPNFLEEALTYGSFAAITADLPDSSSPSHVDGGYLVPAAPRQRVAELPEGWPERLAPEAMGRLQRSAPVLALDTTTIRERVRTFAEAFRGRVGVRFAVKCNPHPGVLAAVVEAGGSFEVASAAELDLALAAGARPASVFYSNPVKPPAHIAATAALGLRRFIVDGPAEIDKIADWAPGTEVLVRVRIRMLFCI